MLVKTRSKRSNRAARRVKATAALLAIKTAQQRYIRDIRRLLAALHGAYEGAVEPYLGDIAKGERFDSGISRWKAKLDALDARIKIAIREPTKEAFDLMADRVNKQNFKITKEFLGLTPTGSRIAEYIASASDENVRLVEDAGRDYADSVRELFTDPSSFALRVEDLKEKLLNLASVSDSRAELIARDQTLKLNGKLNMIRQTNAGVERYVWSTSHDERVRDSHRELDGQEFSWSSPPETGHPGEDFQCRCVALPILEDIEEQS